MWVKVHALGTLEKQNTPLSTIFIPFFTGLLPQASPIPVVWWPLSQERGDPVAPAELQVGAVPLSVQCATEDRPHLWHINSSCMPSRLGHLQLATWQEAAAGHTHMLVDIKGIACPSESIIIEHGSCLQ